MNMECSAFLTKFFWYVWTNKPQQTRRVGCGSRKFSKPESCTSTEWHMCHAWVRQLALLPAFLSLQPPSCRDKAQFLGWDSWDRNFEKRIYLFFLNCKIKTWKKNIFMSSFCFSSLYWIKDPGPLIVALPIELKSAFWKLDNSYSDSHFSFRHPFSRRSVTWSWLLLWTFFSFFFFEIVCLRNGRRERHMLAVEIMLLCFLLSRLSYFPKRVKYHVMRFLSFFVSVIISQRSLSIFFLLPFVICSPGFYISFQDRHFIHWKIASLGSPWNRQYLAQVVEKQQSRAGLFAVICGKVAHKYPLAEI